MAAPITMFQGICSILRLLLSVEGVLGSRCGLPDKVLAESLYIGKGCNGEKREGKDVMVASSSPSCNSKAIQELKKIHEDKIGFRLSEMFQYRNMLLVGGD